jgi:energy-coupling factor transport system ATP-binding protein
MKLELKDLSYVYSPETPYEHAAVTDINLSIGEGEFIGLIGHTGSGKSTLIRHFNGLLRPASGQVLIDGKDIFADKATLKAARFAVGMVFQYPEYQLFEETVYQDVAFGPKNMGLDKDEIDRRVRESLTMVGLDESVYEKSPFALSGGQKRRVAIAGVIAMRPKLLVLDEPAAGLDPRGKREIMTYIQSYAAAGNSVLFISHSMSDVARYAKRVLVMNDSRLVMDGSVNEVFGRADELHAMGLTVPQMTEVFLKLREKGFAVPIDVYTADRAAAALLAYIGGERS